MSNFSKEMQLVSHFSNNGGQMSNDSFNYKSIFLSEIDPDHNNARYLPAIIITDEHAKLFVQRKISKNQLAKLYQAENQVMIGKSCIINCLKYGSNDWKKASKSIDSILELGNNLKVSEVIQVPTIYPYHENRFKVLTGHRRFLAIIYIKGSGSAATFKVYDDIPLLQKTKQFQENASREDLPQYGKLISFIEAVDELNVLSIARIKANCKKMTVRETANFMGISLGAFDNYNVLTRYNCTIKAYENGLTFSFLKTKKIVLSIEKKYKDKYEKTTLNVKDREEVNIQIKRALEGDIEKPIKKYKIAPIKHADTLKKLLSLNIMELDIGFDWESIDWDDQPNVNKVLTKVISYLDEVS